MGGEPQPANIILELRSSPFLRTERSSWTCHRIVPVVIDLFASGRPVKGEGVKSNLCGTGLSIIISGCP